MQVYVLTYKYDKLEVYDVFIGAPGQNVKCMIHTKEFTIQSAKSNTFLSENRSTISNGNGGSF